MAAEERQIRGGDATVKVRSPVNSAIIDVVTIGIYGFYWYYQVNKELAALGRARGSEELGTKPMNSFWAIMPGFFVLIPFLISGYNTGERVQAAQRGSGAGESINPIVAIVAMVVFFPIGIFYVQQELNKVWEAETEGGSGGGESLASGPEAASPEETPSSAEPTPVEREAERQPPQPSPPPQQPGG